MRIANTTKKVTNAAVEKIVASEVSKSQKMKELFNLGLTIKEIATTLNVRYNFVYNVVSNFVTVNSIETVTNKKEGKKDSIIALYKEGKSNKEIAVELKANYNYVFNTLKKYKAEHESE